MAYRIEIRNSGGTERWEVPFVRFSFSELLDKDRSLTVTFNYSVVKVIADAMDITVEYIVSAAYREIYVINSSGTTVYAGYVSDLQFTKGQGLQGTLIVASKGFFSLLRKRYTTSNAKVVYTATDASDIAWDLIDDTQVKTSGNFGITRGTDPTTTSRDRTYLRANIAEAIEDLSAVEIKNGFDFEIDNSKIFNVYYPEKGTQRDNIILEDGFNILTYEIRKTFIDDMINQVHVVGEGFGTDAPVETRDSEAIYKSNFFLLEAVQSEKDVKESATLQAKGDAMLDRLKYPQKYITVTCRDNNPVLTDYSVGDRLKVKIDEYGVNMFMRILKRTVDSDGRVYITFGVL